MRSVELPQRNRYVEALHRAAEALGGSVSLASFLGVDAGVVDRWLAGGEAPPLSAFLRALDVIADGPFARERRIRVGIIRAEDSSSRS